MNNITVLRTERDGVEFFTIAATGESGMSQRGLARACGKALSTVQNLVKNLTDGKPPKRLERFKGMNLNLTDDIEKNGGEVTAYKAEFCSAIIKHYARLGSEKAQDTDDLIGEIGLTSYIQSKTGWLPEEFKAAPKAHDKLTELLSLAKEWEWNGRMVIDDQGHEVDMSESWTFLQEIVFAGFTVDEYIQYEDENRELGLRDYSDEKKIKLFFERNPEIEARLQPYTDKVQKMLGNARHSKIFYDAYLDAYGSSPTSLFERLISSAIAFRRYKRGYVDRTEYANPQPGYSLDSDYMEGWNANTSANLVEK